jgi:predicted Rossmann fold flavoprotein
MATRKKAKQKTEPLPIAVIGGGPAGMTAARTAVESYKRVIVFDKNPVPGKKLASITSQPIKICRKSPPGETARAFGTKSEFILPALKTYGWKEISSSIKKTGLSVSLDGASSIVIPHDDSSLFSIRSKESAESAGVTVKKSSRVTDLEISEGRVKGIVVNGVTIPVSAVIIASGSYSSPKRGSTKDGYELAQKAGHQIIPIKPAMVGLETVEQYGKILADVHVRDCRIDVFVDDTVEFSDRGQLTFTRYGLEGEVILNHAADIIELMRTGKVRIQIDLMPDYTKAKIENLMGAGLDGSDRTTVWEILTRYIPDGMLDVLHKMIRIHSRKPAINLSTLERKLLAVWLKDFTLTVKKPRPFNETRGVVGGVALDDIDPETMRSRKIENLYFAGAVLDLLGPWGGYNIGMAFSTGHLAGLSAAADARRTTRKRSPKSAGAR